MPTLTINLPIYEPCPHREDDLCVRASEALGVETPVSPSVCAYTCRHNGGPYCGQDATDEERWLGSMLAMTSSNSVHKVAREYGSGVEIVVPAITPAIVKAYAHLSAYPWYEGVALSGSSIIAGSTPRDLDVIVWTLSYADYLRDRASIRWPRQIARQKVDAFVKTLPYRGPFIALDLETLTLHTSSLYRIDRLPQGVTIVDTGGGEIAQPILDDMPPRYSTDRRRPLQYAPIAAASPVERPTLIPCDKCSRSAQKNAAE